jgi:hypothetical protein
MAEWRSFAVVPLGAGELHFGSMMRARIDALVSRRHWPTTMQALALSISPVAMLAACGSTAAPATSAANDDYGYEFEHDVSHPATAAAPEQAGPSSSERFGRIPPEAIQSTVRAHFDAFRKCYETGLTTQPDLAGTVKVAFTIGKDGKTLDAAGGASTLPNTDVVDCIVGEFRTLTYPKNEDGIVTVVYPIEFSP